MHEKQRLRRTMMFIPGNNPGMMRDAHIYGSDSLMFDLEDSVSMAEKDAARMLVYNALKTIDYGTTELVVRINPLDTPYGRADIEAMVCAGAHVLRMPKTESAQDIIDCEKVIEEMEIKYTDKFIDAEDKLQKSLDTLEGYKPLTHKEFENLAMQEELRCELASSEKGKTEVSPKNEEKQVSKEPLSADRK